MRNIYIGGTQSKKNNSGLKWKIYFFLFLILGITGAVLKVAGPTIVEEWINEQGSGHDGYAFSIRDVELKLEKGQVVLSDVKIFNPETSNELLESPMLTIQVNWLNILRAEEKMIAVFADKVDLILSKDFSSELERIKAAGENQENDFYLKSVIAQIGQLNIIEKKEALARTVLELTDVNMKVKDVSLLSINKKTEFSVTSQIANGGKLNLTGKTTSENGRTPWMIQGSLKQVPADIFNKVAGDKLPFSFNEASLNAQITAYSEQGKVTGEISPDIKRLNLIEEKPGVPTQVIARALTDELTFTLPFTLKDELTLEYQDTYRKLKTYRRYPTATASTEPISKKSDSFWPF